MQIEWFILFSNAYLHFVTTNLKSVSYKSNIGQSHLLKKKKKLFQETTSIVQTDDHTPATITNGCISFIYCIHCWIWLNCHKEHTKISICEMNVKLFTLWIKFEKTKFDSTTNVERVWFIWVWNCLCLIFVTQS